MNIPIPIEQLTPANLLPFTIWRFVPENASGNETLVKPILRLPMKSLDGCLIGTVIHFANGKELPAILGNLSPKNPKLNEHFATLTVFRSDGLSFQLASYHDFNFSSYSPMSLAKFIGIPINETFPMDYMLPENLVEGLGIFRGTFEAEPRTRLSRAEIIALAVP